MIKSLGLVGVGVRVFYVLGVVGLGVCGKGLGLGGGLGLGFRVLRVQG
jgi:hypothetical protein